MAKKFELNISDEALEAVAEKIGKETIESLKQLGDNKNLLLKKIALDYLTIVKEHIKKIEALEQAYVNRNEIKKELEKQDPKTDKTIKEYKKAKEKLKSLRDKSQWLQEFFQQSLIFNERIVEAITGKKSKISIVIPIEGENGFESVIVQEYTIEELFAKNSGVKIAQDFTSAKVPRIVGKLRYDIEQMKRNLENALQNDKQIDSEEVEALNETYFEALRDYKNHNPYVFWKPLNTNQWFKMKIGSGGKGDISEAYAYFFYKSAEKNFRFQNNHLYDNLHIFFKFGVGQVSNLSGLYAGDVSTTQYEYAVKSLRAALPGYIQMIELAQQIINNEIVGVSQGDKNLIKKKKIQEKIGKGLRNIIIDVVENTYIEQLEQSYTGI